MPLTIAEQNELNALSKVYEPQQPAGPAEAGTELAFEPLPASFPVTHENLSKDENRELAGLEAKFETKGQPEQRQFQNAGDEFVRALARGTLNVGSGLLNTIAQAGGPGAIFDPQAVSDLADRARKASQSPKFQPGKDGGVSGFVANAVGDALPFMAGVIGATLTTGPVGGFGVAFAVEGSNAYQDALDAGASQQDAEIEGFVVGSINAALEQLQVERVLKFADAGKGSVRAIFNAAKTKSLRKIVAAGKDIGKEALKLSITEGVQEALQETTSVLAPALTGREIQPDGKIKRILQAGLGGAVVGPILGGAGAVTKAALEGKSTFSRKDVKEQFGIDKSSAEERQALFDKEKGLEDAERITRQAGEVSEAEGIEGREQEIQGVRVRDVTEGREAEREEVAPEVVQEEITAPAVAQEQEVVPAEVEVKKKIVSEEEFQALLAEEAEAVKKPTAVEKKKRQKKGKPAVAKKKVLDRDQIEKKEPVKEPKTKVAPISEAVEGVIKPKKKGKKIKTVEAKPAPTVETSDFIEFTTSGGTKAEGTVSKVFEEGKLSIVPLGAEGSDTTVPINPEQVTKIVQRKGRKFVPAQDFKQFDSDIMKTGKGETPLGIKYEIGKEALGENVPKDQFSVHIDIFGDVSTMVRDRATGNMFIGETATRQWVTKHARKMEAKLEKETAPESKTFGAKNTIVTKQSFEKLKAEEQEAKPLRGKRAKGMRKGSARIFNAKDLVRAGKFGVYYFEGGVRQFADWSGQMVKTMGDAIKPHLEKIWAKSKQEVEAFETEEPAVEVKKAVPQPEKKTVDKPKNVQVVLKDKATPEKVEGTNLPEANTSSEVDAAVGDVLSVKNLKMAEVRADLGLGPVPSAKTKSQQTSVDNAIAKNIPAEALRIATEVQENPRILDDEEQAGLLVRSVQLRDQYETARKKLLSTENEAEISLLNATMNRLEAEYDIISLSLKTAGTELGRALAFRRNSIDENYDILSVKSRARAAKGKPLSEAQEKKFDELVGELKEANEKLAEAVEKMDNLTAERIVDNASIRGKKGKKPTAGIASLSAQINELLDQGCM